MKSEGDISKWANLDLEKIGIFIKAHECSVSLFMLLVKHRFSGYDEQGVWLYGLYTRHSEILIMQIISLPTQLCNQNKNIFSCRGKQY